ncbi:CysO-cysteine peptidase [Mycobacterium talmoniae]|uniref:CysO-cysteine peptidase n=1 Tax=Mycobacterium talmoniae TaxID=1858794 RepID=A0A2S8BGL8_9MYCO|nr:CysO-cysteine peptidase [Mycobacterium talmoniae]
MEIGPNSDQLALRDSVREVLHAECPPEVARQALTDPERWRPLWKTVRELGWTELAGPDGSDRPQRHIAMLNAERSPTFYRFDSAEQLRVWRAMDEADEAPVVIYHSHTATEAYPSRTDVSLAAEPDAHYVLVSTRDPDSHELRSYRIVDGVVTEEPVRIVESYEEPA